MTTHLPAPDLPRLGVRDRPEPATVAQFARDGHVLVSGLADGAEVVGYRAAVRAATLAATRDVPALADRGTYGKAFLQVPNLWRTDADVARFVLADRFSAYAAALLGVDRVRLYHDQALFKEPGGGHTPWHQDAVYWPFDTDQTLTMWMPLVDLAEDMGGLSFATGSHRGRALGDVTISDESETFFADLVADGRFPIFEPGPMRAGDATFHAGWTLHRARPNTSRTLREVMTVIWFADGLTVAEPRNADQRSDLAQWLPGTVAGDVAASALNPVLPVGAS